MPPAADAEYDIRPLVGFIEPRQLLHLTLVQQERAPGSSEQVQHAHDMIDTIRSSPAVRQVLSRLADEMSTRARLRQPAAKNV